MQVQKSTLLDVRRTNRSTVLRNIYRSQSVRRQELSQASGLSSASVANVVAELLQEGFVIEAGMEASQGGRPRSILTMNPFFGYFIGVEIGDTLIRVELFDLTLCRLCTVNYSLLLSQTEPEQVVQFIDLGVQTVLDISTVEREKVIGVGVSVGGIVEQDEQAIVSLPAWKWRRISLVALLQEHLHLPVLLDNASRVMAQAESLFGVAQGYEHAAVLLVETGIGAGVIVNHVLYRGASNSAGEWGHTKIVLDGRVCRCGSRGCLEAYAGAPGIIASLREIAPESSFLHHRNQEDALSALWAAARNGDAIATQVLKQTAHYLGAGIANLINLFNPQLIVLAGRVGLQIGETILSELQQYIENYALKEPLAATRLVLSQLGQDAAAMGAATLVLEAFLVAAGKPSSHFTERRALA